MSKIYNRYIFKNFYYLCARNINNIFKQHYTSLFLWLFKKKQKYYSKTVIFFIKIIFRVRQKQLSQIYELMQKQTEKFGEISLSEIEEQFKLYQ